MRTAPGDPAGAPPAETLAMWRAARCDCPGTADTAENCVVQFEMRVCRGAHKVIFPAQGPPSCGRLAWNRQAPGVIAGGELVEGHCQEYSVGIIRFSILELLHNSVKDLAGTAQYTFELLHN